jgi:hypothetical protein
VLQPFAGPKGFTILPVHYTHDPVKATDEWYSQAREDYRSESKLANIDAAWAMEFEIDFGSHMGAAVYTSFNRARHIREGLLHDPRLPLLLTVDFNVAPMIWEIAQIRNGVLFVVDEIAQAPASVESMVQEFRNRYSDQQAELIIYGDATGNSRSSQTARTSYELMAIAFRGFPAAIQWRVKTSNPKVKDRVNSVNLKLSAPDGSNGVVMDAKCRELIADMLEVAWRPDGKDLLKINDPTRPEALRTHASDALGYLIDREWPARGAETRLSHQPKRKPRVKPKSWLGRM